VKEMALGVEEGRLLDITIFINVEVVIYLIMFCTIVSV